MPPSIDYTCHDCGVAPGEFHHIGCDVEQCRRCGLQALQCYGFAGDPGGTEQLRLVDCAGCAFDPKLRLPWTGEFPGKVECRELGWYAKFVWGVGWVRCLPSDPDAREYLNRLYDAAACGELEWSIEDHRFYPTHEPRRGAREANWSPLLRDER
jgi:hypothetical protein